MNYEKYLKKYENIKNGDIFTKLIKYLTPLIPTLTFLLIDVFIKDSIDKKYYINILLSSLFPLVCKDFFDYILNNKNKHLELHYVVFGEYDYNFKNCFRIFLKNEKSVLINSTNKSIFNHSWDEYEKKLYINNNTNDILNNLKFKINNIDYNCFFEYKIVKDSDCKDLYIYHENIKTLEEIIKYIEDYKPDEYSVVQLFGDEKRYEIKTISKNFNSYENIIISDNNLEKLNLKLKNFTNNEYIEKLKILGINNNLHIHLHGCPGSGKTSLCMAIANKLNKNIMFVDKNNPKLFFDNLLSFKNNEMVFVFDDIDFWNLKERLNKDKEGIESSNIYLMKMMELLNGNILNNSVIILTSNTENFNKAMTRDGRIHLRLDMNEFDDISLYNKFFNIFYNNKNWKYKFTENEIKKLISKKITLVKISEIAKNNIFDENNFIKQLKNL